jgi:putative transposase
MSKPLRTAASGTFFITAITANRIRLFQVERHAQLFLDTLQHYRRKGAYKLHAFVAMPDHVHLLLTTENLAESMKRIRGGFSYRLSSAHEVWQRGYADHAITSREDFLARRSYVHLNPVRAHLVEHAHLYPYSSAFRVEPFTPRTPNLEQPVLR